MNRIVPNPLMQCSRCGEGIDLDLDLEDVRFSSMLAEGLRCRECRLAAPPFEQAVAYGLYEDELRVLIHLLKYERVRPVARLLGSRLAETILRLEPHAANDLLVVAVPLFRARERQRGYNQSVLLAAEALRVLAKQRPQWTLTAAHGTLVRRRATESQFVLSRRGRRHNLGGAFQVHGDVEGREVLLIDDIMTSGATARECARVLIRAGAAKVWVATVARAQTRALLRQHTDPGEYVVGWDLPGPPAMNTAGAS